MRIVGLDVSRSVAEIAYLEDGVLRAGGRAGLRRDELERFAAKLHQDDHVVLEATGNTAAIVNVLRPHVARVAIANPLQVWLIAEARVKTDKIDAAVLAQLCNDPAEPAQVKRLMQMPQPGSSCRAPGVGAGGYKSVSSPLQRGWRAGWSRSDADARIALSTCGSRVRPSRSVAGSAA